MVLVGFLKSNPITFFKGVVMRFLKVFLVVVLLSVISSAFAQSNTLSLWARNTFTHDVYQNPDIGINLVHNFKDSK